MAIASNGETIAWGFSENYRMGLGTEESVVQPTRMESEDIKGKEMTFAGCGGQFSLLVGSSPYINGI